MHGRNVYLGLQPMICPGCQKGLLASVPSVLYGAVQECPHCQWLIPAAEVEGADPVLQHVLQVLREESRIKPRHAGHPARKRAAAPKYDVLRSPRTEPDHNGEEYTPVKLRRWAMSESRVQPGSRPVPRAAAADRIRAARNERGPYPTSNPQPSHM